MAKYFKSKKIIRRMSIFKYLLFAVVIYLLLHFCISILSIIEPNKLLSFNFLIKDCYEFIKDNTINTPVNLLNYEYISNDIVIIPVVDVIEDKKKIYIYSTHQAEEYADNKSVVKASKYLKKQLSEENIDVTVEEGNIQEFLVMNNYSYNYSYVASRYFVEEELKLNKYDLIIDLHRDAVSRNASTTTINNKKCAKVMFVIGKKNKNYKKNYKIAKEINKMINDKYPSLTRGVLLQDGKNVNGIYNQDLSDNLILIELGGNNNSYAEAKNTIDLISPIIGEYLNGKKV